MITIYRFEFHASSVPGANPLYWVPSGTDIMCSVSRRDVRSRFACLSSRTLTCIPSSSGQENLGKRLSLHVLYGDCCHFCLFETSLQVTRACHRTCLMVDAQYILLVLNRICWWLILCDDWHLPNRKLIIIRAAMSWPFANIILSTDGSIILSPFPRCRTEAQADRKNCSWVIQRANGRGGTWTNLAWFKRFVFLPSKPGRLQSTTDGSWDAPR